SATGAGIVGCRTGRATRAQQDQRGGQRPGAAPTASTAAPFAGPRLPVQLERDPRPVRPPDQARTGEAGRTSPDASPCPDPMFALPLAAYRGYCLIGILTRSDTYRAPPGCASRPSCRTHGP